MQVRVAVCAKVYGTLRVNMYTVLRPQWCSEKRFSFQLQLKTLRQSRQHDI